MESFNLFQKHLAICGIAISKEPPNRHPFNAKNLTIFFMGCAVINLSAASLLEAKAFDERTDILFQSVSFGVCILDYAIMVWKTSKLSEFINSLANAVTKSEC